jgi:uncharacterized protein (DUF2141 family)
MFRRLADFRLGVLGCVLFALVLANPAAAARLLVTIEGIRSSEGYVFVTLYSKPQGFPDGDYSAQHAKVKAASDGLTIVFDNVVAGAYAVGAYHDENNNGKLDTNFFGYPIEGYALSNGIRAETGRPRFSDAAFQVGDRDTAITLHIRY